MWGFELLLRMMGRMGKKVIFMLVNCGHYEFFLFRNQFMLRFILNSLWLIDCNSPKNSIFYQVSTLLTHEIMNKYIKQITNPEDIDKTCWNHVHLLSLITTYPKPVSFYSPQSLQRTFSVSCPWYTKSRRTPSKSSADRVIR